MPISWRGGPRAMDRRSFAPREKESTNPEDKYAVAVKKCGKTVGHVPFNLAPVMSAFLKDSSNKGHISDNLQLTKLLQVASIHNCWWIIMPENLNAKGMGCATEYTSYMIELILN